MSRPSNWYDMTYSDQMAWERTDREHRRAVEDAEYEADRQREDARREAERAEHAQRVLRAERDEYAEETSDLSEKNQKLREEVRMLRVKLAEITGNPSWVGK